MTAITRFERSVTIRCEAAAIHGELADPQRQLGLQPLLTSVVEIHGDESARVRNFEAVEVVRIFGWIPWKNRIRVRIESIRTDEVLEFEARSRPGIVVRSRFTIAKLGAESRVREEVRVDSPRVIHTCVTAEAIRAQEDCLANLKRRLEARTGTT